jgi:cyclopropane fatty-acyl-phospholipid synthase-like methyltransferase
MTGLAQSVTHEWDWWAYQLRVVHRRGIEGIDAWDEQLVAFVIQGLDLRPGERLLDLACGSGAHALRLARQGVRVVGIDIAPSLVRHCSDQAAAAGLASATFVQGDMRALEFNEEFDAVVVLGGSFGFFDDATNERVAGGIARALKPGGRLLLQLLDPFTCWERQERRRHREERPEGTYQTETWVDPATRTSHSVIRFTDKDGVTHLANDDERLRLYALPEVREIMANVGLTFTAAHGDTLLPPIPYAPGRSKQMIAMGRRQVGRVQPLA